MHKCLLRIKQFNAPQLLRTNTSENPCTVYADISIESEIASEMDDDYSDTEQSSELEW